MKVEKMHSGWSVTCNFLLGAARNAATPAGIAGGALVLLLAVVEAFSVDHAYVLAPATIQTVSKASGFQCFAENVTAVKYVDGYVIELCGALGKPGDEILAKRRVGSKTLFGWFGDYSYREAPNAMLSRANAVSIDWS